MMNDKISALIRDKIDPLTGGLVLDPIQTAKLVSWLTTIEIAVNQQAQFTANLKKIIEDLKNGK